MKKIIGITCALSACIFLVCCSSNMGPIDSTVTVAVNLQCHSCRRMERVL